jgi:hypothetical protein
LAGNQRLGVNLVRRQIVAHPPMRWFDMDRKPSLEIQLRLRRTFLAHGFRELTMGGIALACGFTRRNL